MTIDSLRQTIKSVRFFNACPINLLHSALESIELGAEAKARIRQSVDVNGMESAVAAIDAEVKIAQCANEEAIEIPLEWLEAI